MYDDDQMGDEQAWPDLPLAIAATPARIAPGMYYGRTAKLSSYRSFGRRVVQIDFEIRRAGDIDGLVLARLPCFFRVPDWGVLAASSKLQRLLDRVEPRGRRQPRVRL